VSKTKATGVSRLGRDSAAQRLGVKLHAGEKAKIGSILVRQRGTKYLAGKNVKIGSDDTLYAIKEGVVNFTTKRAIKFDGRRRLAKVVNVI